VTLPSMTEDQAAEIVRSAHAGLPVLERDARQHRRRPDGQRPARRRL